MNANLLPACCDCDCGGDCGCGGGDRC